MVVVVVMVVVVAVVVIVAVALITKTSQAIRELRRVMWNNKKGVEKMRKFSKNEDACRMKVHWRCTCGTSNHFVDLYQASLKEGEGYRDKPC